MAKHKLTIKLPGVHRKSQRLDSQNVISKKPSSTNRVKKHRQQLQLDPIKLAKHKKKKQEENKVYKAKVKAKRLASKVFDDEYKKQQNKWKKSSREKAKTVIAQENKRKAAKKTANILARQKAKQCREREERNKARDKARQAANRKKQKVDEQQQLQRPNEVSSTPIKTTPTSETFRKRSLRFRKDLQNTSPRNWTRSVASIINDGTPKRRNNLLKGLSVTPHSAVVETLELNKIGRPKKALSHVKQKITYNDEANPICPKKASVKRYTLRKKYQALRKTKPAAYQQKWKGKIHEFLEENSRVMPNKKDTILVNGTPTAKRHLLCTKYQAYQKFKKENPQYQRKFTTFYKMIPKHIRSLNLVCRRVCVCTKCYNIEQQVQALNKVANDHSMLNLKTTVRKLSEESTCPSLQTISNSQCIYRKCAACGTGKLQKKYAALIKAANSTKEVKYYQWKNGNETYVDKNKKWHTIKRWKQVEEKCTLQELLNRICKVLEMHTSHIYRSDYQHRVQTDLMTSLPIDQCVAVMDFSENITLQPQDEIESAHWTQKQVTLHPVFIVRHDVTSTTDKPVLKKEAMIMITDYMAHNAAAVYVFTNQLLIHLKNNPGPSPIRVLHRFSDNCAVQYKCIEAFTHIAQLEETHKVKLYYHYTEAGHGKGPSDGLGAATKKKIDRLILGGTVVNNAYQVYLALAQNECHVQKEPSSCEQTIMYLPRRKMLQEGPKKEKKLKSIKGTQQFHMVQLLKPGSDILISNNLSCACVVCLGVQMGPCYYGQFRDSSCAFNMATGKRISQDELQPTICAPLEPIIACSTDNSCSISSDVDHDANLINALKQSELTHAEHQLDVAKSISAFNIKANEKGLKIRGQTPNDGNCLYWALSDQLDLVSAGTCSFTHAQLRCKIVSHMQSFSEDAKADMQQFLVDTDLESYISNQQKDGTYADQLCIKVLCDILECQIRIVTSTAPDIIVGSASTELVVGHLPDIKHYVSLEPIVRYSPQNGDFVVLQLESKKTKRMFVAKILQVDGSSDVQVRYMKSIGKSGNFTWASELPSWESPDDIIGQLSPPVLQPGRGLYLKFDTDELASCGI